MTRPYPHVKRRNPTWLTPVIAAASIAWLLLCCSGWAVAGNLTEDDQPARRPATVVGSPERTPSLSPVPVTPSTPEPSLSVFESSPSLTSPAAASTTPADGGGNGSSGGGGTRTTVPAPRATTPRVTTRPPTPRATTAAAERQGITPGAFCSPEGAYGRSKAGKLYRCARNAGEDQARWRAA